MSITNRRCVLMGLAAASTTAATSIDAATHHENPYLVELASGLSGLVGAYTTARDRTRIIVENAAKIWPEAPEEIRLWVGKSKPEADITGAGIPRPMRGNSDVKQVMNIGLPDGFEAAIAGHKSRIACILTTKSKRRLKFEQLRLERMEVGLPLSKTYWSEVERVTRASGYEEAKRLEKGAFSALKDRVQKIMDAEPETMEGVVIQAQAIGAWQEVSPFERTFDLDAMGWPSRLASSLLRQAAG